MMFENTLFNYTHGAIVVWNGVIARIETLKGILGKDDIVRLATRDEIEQYKKHQ